MWQLKQKIPIMFLFSVLALPYACNSGSTTSPDGHTSLEVSKEWKIEAILHPEVTLPDGSSPDDLPDHLKEHTIPDSFVLEKSGFTEFHSEKRTPEQPTKPDLPPQDKTSSPWTALTQRMKQAVTNNEIVGGFAILDIYRKDGTKAYSQSFGKAKSRDEPLPVASASKWVTSTILLALVDKKILALNDTTNKWLGWTGSIGKITLRQLLSFTSGAQAPLCHYIEFMLLKSCVERVKQKGLYKPPGESFNYGPQHMAIAAVMAETASKKLWATLFKTYITIPSGFTAQATYYTIPKKKSGKSNPLVAGGLVISTADYGRFLTALQGIGRPALLSSQLRLEQYKEQWSSTTTIKDSPNKKIHYALGCWRECPTPNDVKACDTDLVVHSAGAFGFIPFIDTKNEYYGVLSAEAEKTKSGAATKNIKLLMQDLRPMITKALKP